MTLARDVRPDVLNAAFDFARRMDDPKFRRHLKKKGWKPETGLVIALDEDKVVNVVRRIAFNETTSPCLVAIPNPLERHGFALMFAIVAPARLLAKRGWNPLRDPPMEIHPESTIGMVWSSLQRCGEYAPNEWFQPVMFEKVSV